MSLGFDHDFLHDLGFGPLALGLLFDESLLESQLKRLSSAVNE